MSAVDELAAVDWQQVRGAWEQFGEHMRAWAAQLYAEFNAIMERSYEQSGRPDGDSHEAMLQWFSEMADGFEARDPALHDDCERVRVIVAFMRAWEASP